MISESTSLCDGVKGVLGFDPRFEARRGLGDRRESVTSRRAAQLVGGMLERGEILLGQELLQLSRPDPEAARRNE